MNTNKNNWLSQILQKLNSFGFEEIEAGELKEVDKKEANKILNDWISGELEVVDAKLGNNPIDEIRILLWKQVIPKKTKNNLTPSNNNYEGVVAKIRRIKSKKGYKNDNFYLEKENKKGNLVEFERLKKTVLFNH